MTEHLPLRGRTAVVTGAARGIGEAAARELARRGPKVALLGLEEPLLARIAASIPGAAHWPDDPGGVVPTGLLGSGGTAAETARVNGRRSGAG